MRLAKRSLGHLGDRRSCESEGNGGLSRATDFRLTSFDPIKVEFSGKFIGGRVYWKLYFVENVFRVIVNSVLLAQTGTKDWWLTAVDPRIQKNARDAKKKYLDRPWYTKPGEHDIYYIHLWELNEIMRANSNLFLPVIPDIDSWIARIEQLRLPRNIVCHMNFLNRVDRERIDVFCKDSMSLLDRLQTKMASLSWTLQVP
jgi:hypothetical protein